MNVNHVQQIFAHYIDEFERINNAENREYYKWQIIKRFHDEMDAALSAPADVFPARLYEMKKLSSNLIDSYTQPFHGLVKFAEREPETVRRMFMNLYSADDDIKNREKRIQEFLIKSHELREKYYPDSFLYKDDMHSVTGYLFLYDPDHNYIFKSTHAQIFADCIEFYDDWGSGDTVRLDVYYRMCDQLVEEIKATKELMATDASRFSGILGENPETLYEDPEKHILAFDLIYCCSTYGLFDGISFVRPKSKERQLIHERKEKALQLLKKYEEAKKNMELLREAQNYINSVYITGKPILHKRYGKGVVLTNSGTILRVDFSEVGEKNLGTFISVANDIISLEDSEYLERVSGFRDCLKRESLIKTTICSVEKELAAYEDYL